MSKASDFQTSAFDGDDDNLDAPVTLRDIKRLFETQTRLIEEKLATQLTALCTEMNVVKTAVQSMAGDISALKERTNGVETACETLAGKQDETTNMIARLREKMDVMEKRYEAEIDKLEAFSRRDNLRFFGMAESANETFEICAKKVVDMLKDIIPGKTWKKDDIVRAHRVGKAPTYSAVTAGNGQSKPRPMIVKFQRWQDKMDILMKGRSALKRKGIQVAGDLTSRQQAEVKRHRDIGERAFYRGNKLVVEGPLQQQRGNNSSSNNNNNDRGHGRGGGGRDGQAISGRNQGRRSRSNDETLRKSPVDNARESGGALQGAVGGARSNSKHGQHSQQSRITEHWSRVGPSSPRQSPKQRPDRSQSAKWQRVSSSGSPQSLQNESEMRCDASD